MDSAKDRLAGDDPKGRPAIESLELRGLKCPLPAIRTAKALARLRPGAVLKVLADDPLAALDLAHLCRTEGHALLNASPAAGGGLNFRIQRGADRPAPSEPA